MRNLRLKSALSIVVFFSAVPLTVGSSVIAPVELAGACGQASSCKKQYDYICSTYHSDYQDYTCNTGCDEGDG